MLNLNKNCELQEYKPQLNCPLCENSSLQCFYFLDSAGHQHKQVTLFGLYLSAACRPTKSVIYKDIVLYIQVNFCISNSDISNTIQVSKRDDGPNRFIYIYDLRNPGISNTLISNTLLISKQIDSPKYENTLVISKFTKFLAPLNSHL